MVHRMDIAIFQINLIDGSSYSGDDIVARETCLEIGFSDHRTYDIGPDFSFFQ